MNVLTDKVNSCTQLLDAQEIGNALYGMQDMSSDVEEVQMSTRALFSKVDAWIVASKVNKPIYSFRRVS